MVGSAAMEGCAALPTKPPLGFGGERELLKGRYGTAFPLYQLWANARGAVPARPMQAGMQRGQTDVQLGT